MSVSHAMKLVYLFMIFNLKLYVTYKLHSDCTPAISFTLFISSYIYIYDEEESHQGKALQTHPWVVSHEYMTPPARTMHRVIQGKLLVEIEPRMHESITHPKPHTN